MCNILNFYTMHLHKGPILKSPPDCSVEFWITAEAWGFVILRLTDPDTGFVEIEVASVNQ